MPDTRLQPDTNVLVQYIRQSDVAVRIEEQTGLLNSTPAPVVATITLGEAEFFALRRNWSAERKTRMRSLFGGMITAWLDTPEVILAYANIAQYCMQRGKQLSQNDLWIAATAHITGATLLTTDRDFDILHNVFFSRRLFDAKTGDLVPAEGEADAGTGR